LTRNRWQENVILYLHTINETTLHNKRESITGYDWNIIFPIWNGKERGKR